MSNYKELKTISKEYTGKEIFIIATGLGINVKDDKDCLIDFNNTFPLKNHNAILTMAGNKYVIYYKPCKFKEYYILHEICHYILKHNADGEYEEMQSNVLACMILIPDNAIYMDTHKISELYNIPVDVVISYINYLKANTNLFKKRRLMLFSCVILSVSVMFISCILLRNITFKNTEPDKTSVVFSYSETTTEQPVALTTQAIYDIVYITKTGDKYHKQDCYYIRGRNTLAITLSEANNQGYLPCSVCYQK